MQKQFNTLFFILSIFLLSACGGGSDQANNNNSNASSNKQNQGTNASKNNIFGANIKDKFALQDPNVIELGKKKEWTKVDAEFGNKYLSQEKSFEYFFGSKARQPDGEYEEFSVFYYAYFSNPPKGVDTRVAFYNYFQVEGSEDDIILVDFDKDGKIIRSQNILEGSSGGVWDTKGTGRFLANNQYQSITELNYPPANNDVTTTTYQQNTEGVFEQISLDVQRTFEGSIEDLAAGDVFIIPKETEGTTTSSATGYLLHWSAGLDGGLEILFVTDMLHLEAKILTVNSGTALFNYITNENPTGQLLKLDYEVQQGTTPSGELNAYALDDDFSAYYYLGGIDQQVRLLERDKDDYKVYVEGNIKVDPEGKNTMIPTESGGEYIKGFIPTWASGRKVSVCSIVLAKRTVTNFEALD